jgi:hypothetical protein
MMYLNHTKAELKKFSKSKLVSIGTQILKRFPKRALPGTIYVMEQSAKRYGIKSIGKIAKRVKRKARSGAKRIKSRGKKIGEYRKSKKVWNGRRRKKLSWQVKGSPSAKRHMAKIRAMR